MRKQLPVVIPQIQLSLWRTQHNVVLCASRGVLSLPGKMQFHRFPLSVVLSLAFLADFQG